MRSRFCATSACSRPSQRATADPENKPAARPARISLVGMLNELGQAFSARVEVRNPPDTRYSITNS